MYFRYMTVLPRPAQAHEFFFVGLAFVRTCSVPSVYFVPLSLRVLFLALFIFAPSITSWCCCAAYSSLLISKVQERGKHDEDC